MDMWPTTFAWRGPVAEPTSWGKPGLVMVFNLECAACISRGIPLLKRLAADYGDRLVPLLVHTTYGHRPVEPERVASTARHFAESFARLEVPIAIDPDEGLARAWGVEGTPHWFVFDARRPAGPAASTGRRTTPGRGSSTRCRSCWATRRSIPRRARGAAADGARGGAVPR